MKIAAVIPAYNESRTICSVINPLIASGDVSEIIVVDDGSTDTTAEVSVRCGARVIRQANAGKGAAMRKGVQSADADILLFLDADLVGLTVEHIRALLAPVQGGSAGMTVGLRDKGVLTQPLARIAPILGGERALRRDTFLAMMDSAIGGIDDFGIETVMNDYCTRQHLAVEYVFLSGVTHVLKEQKYGFLNGFLRRLRMGGQILRAEYVTLRTKK